MRLFIFNVFVCETPVFYQALNIVGYNCTDSSLVRTYDFPREIM